MIPLQVRHGCPADRAGLQELLASYAMETDIDPLEFWVAEADGTLYGAARLEWEENAVYVRPVVVASGRQTQGAGRALIQTLAHDHAALYVVARGEAQGFYARLGFTEFAWEQVPARFRLECEACPDRSGCHPAPMVLVRQALLE